MHCAPGALHMELSWGAVGGQSEVLPPVPDVPPVPTVAPPEAVVELVVVLVAPPEPAALAPVPVVSLVVVVVVFIGAESFTESPHALDAPTTMPAQANLAQFRI